MAARTHAGAPLCPNRAVFSCLETVCDCSSSSCFHISRRTYSREFVLDIRKTLFTDINPADTEKLRDCSTPDPHSCIQPTVEVPRVECE